MGAIEGNKDIVGTGEIVGKDDGIGGIHLLSQ